MFSEHTQEELESESAVTLTLVELKALQLSSSGDVFAPGSLLSTNLESAASKLDFPSSAPIAASAITRCS